MKKMNDKFCINCGSILRKKRIDEREFLACSIDSCNFVLWNNPIPIVGGIVETDEGVILAHNKAWPENIFSIVTGFLASYESPKTAIVREVKEELNLISTSTTLIDVYPYEENNQIIIVYHVYATGNIILNEELDSYKIYAKEELKNWPFGQDKLKGWPFGCGWAIRDWLNNKRDLFFKDKDI